MEKFPTILIDASGVPLKALFANNGGIVCSREYVTQALEGLPSILETLLKEAGHSMCEVKNFVLCIGPGSMLGTRIASAMLFTLKNLSPESKFFVYDTLQAHAYAMFDSEKAEVRNAKKFAILAPSRKGFTNMILAENGKIISESEVLESFSFPENSYLLNQRNAPPPEALKDFPELEKFPVSKIFEVLQKNKNLLEEICETAPEPKTLSEREYVKWK